MKTFRNHVVVSVLLISLFSNPVFSDDVKSEPVWKRWAVGLFKGLSSGSVDSDTDQWLQKPGTKVKIFSKFEAGKELHIDSVGGQQLPDGTWVGGKLVFNSCECGTNDCLPILPPMYTFDMKELTYSTSTFVGILKKWWPVALGGGLLIAGAGTGGAISGAATAAGSELNPQGNGTANLHAQKTVKQMVKSTTAQVHTTTPGTETPPVVLEVGGPYKNIVDTYKGYLIAAKDQLNPDEKDKKKAKQEHSDFNKSINTWKGNGGTLRECSTLVNDKLDRILAGQAKSDAKPAVGAMDQERQTKGASDNTTSPVIDNQELMSSSNIIDSSVPSGRQANH